MHHSGELQSQIQQSETKAYGKYAVSEYLEEAQKIKAYFKSAYGKDSEKYKKIHKEYTELEQSIQESLEDNKINTKTELEQSIQESLEDNKINTKTELKQISKEYNDIKEIESYKNYWKRQGQELKEFVKGGARDNIVDSISSILVGFNNASNPKVIMAIVIGLYEGLNLFKGKFDNNTKEKWESLKEEYNRIKKKKISEEEELEFKLQASQLIYSLGNDFPGLRNTLNKFKINVIEEAHNKATANIVSKILLTKKDHIISFQDGYGEKEDAKGYSIIKISDFEKQLEIHKEKKNYTWFLKNHYIETINYLYRLKISGNLNTETLNEKFGKNNTKYVLLICKKGQEIPKPIEEIIEKSGLKVSIQKLIEENKDVKAIEKLDESKIDNKKSIQKLSENQAVQALELSNLKYDQSKDKKDTRIFQEKLIKKILKTKQNIVNGYNQEYMRGYDSSKGGNFLMKISDFDAKARSGERLKAKETAVYLIYLNEQYQDPEKYDEKLEEIFGNGYRERLKIIFDEGEDKHVEKIISILKKENIIQGSSFFSYIKSKFGKLFDSFENLIHGFESLTPSEQKKVLKEMKEDLNDKQSELYKEIKSSIGKNKQISEREKDKRIKEIIKALKETEDNESIYTTLIDYKKKRWLVDMSIKDLTDKTNDLKEAKIKVDYIEKTISGNTKEAEEARKKMKILQYEKQINKALTEENWKELEKSLIEGKDIDEIMKELRRKNKDLDYLYQQKEQEEQIGKKEDPLNKQSTQKTGTENEENNNIKKTASGNYFFPEIDGEITQQEKNIIERNPEVKENLIDFYNFFKDINMLGVWKYRRELIKAMENRDINLEDNFLGKNELLLFGNNIIKIINNLTNTNQYHTQNSIAGLKQELRNYSEADSDINDNKSFNTLGEDKFTASLRENGIINETHGLQIETLRTYL